VNGRKTENLRGNGFNLGRERNVTGVERDGGGNFPECSYFGRGGEIFLLLHRRPGLALDVVIRPPMNPWPGKMSISSRGIIEDLKKSHTALAQTQDDRLIFATSSLP